MSPGAVVGVVLACVVATSGFAVTQDDLPGPRILQVGYAATPQATREAASSNTWSLGVGLRPWRQGLVGSMGLDAEFLTSHGQSGTLDRVGALYSERVPLYRRIYAGAGVGLWAIQWENQVDSETTYAVRPALRAIVGYTFPELPNRRVRPALEGAVTYAGAIQELDLTTVTVALVIGF